jgi:solute carrier family 25 phosphate transporter 3
MIPTDSVLAEIASRHPLGGLGMQIHSEQPAKLNPRREPFPAWSAIDDAKHKADAFAKEAVREYDVVSKSAQRKTGKIEPWTPKYYAACTFGGMMACVCSNIYFGWDACSQ